MALLAMLAGLLVWQIQQTLEIQNAVDHSDRVISQLNTLERLAVDQETGMRGYQLTGLRVMLEPYEAAATTIGSTYEALRALSDEDLDRSRQVAKLGHTLKDWQEFASSVVEARNRSLRITEALTVGGKTIMDTLRSEITRLVQTETARREALSDRVHKRVARFLSIVLVLALAAGILIGIFTSSRLRLVSSAFDSALQQLQDRNEELFSSRQLLLATFQSIDDAVISCDEDGAILFMNAVAQEFTQCPIAEALGKPIDQVLKIRNDTASQPMENLLEEMRRSHGLGVASQAVLIGREGAELSIDYSTSPVRTTDGGTRGMVIVFRDVTEMRKAEATLIANEKLAVTGRLAASIAHEIHNPLDSVANLHFLLAKEQSADKRAELLALAQQELGRTLQISRAMLSLYRESQVPVEVDLKELIASVLLLLDRKLKDQAIVLEQSFTHPTTVEGFPGELRQVFTNLIANAAEAAGYGGRVRIQVRPATPQEGRAGTLVEISDSGPGIAPHVEKKLFQPFITTKGERGTGLGLWVSLGIVRKHGGSVRINNNAQGELGGAMVRVYLPEKAAVNPTAAAPLV